MVRLSPGRCRDGKQALYADGLSERINRFAKALAGHSFRSRLTRRRNRQTRNVPFGAASDF